MKAIYSIKPRLPDEAIFRKSHEGIITYSKKCFMLPDLDYVSKNNCWLNEKISIF